MFLTALYIHYGQVFRTTVDSSCTALRQYEYTPEGVCTLKEEEEEEKRRGCVKGLIICLHSVLSFIPVNLICNMTTFIKKNIFDLTQGSRVCQRAT